MTRRRRLRDSGIHIMQICLHCLASRNNAGSRVDGGQPSGRVPIALLYCFANVIAVRYMRRPINIMRTAGPRCLIRFAWAFDAASGLESVARR